MYAPTLARFTALDPMPPDGEPVLLGASRYEYAENDPVNRYDPSGMQDTGKGGGGQKGKTCRIANHCWQVKFLGAQLQKHCGLTMQTDDGTFWVDGGPEGDIPFLGDGLISVQPPNTFPGRPTPPFNPPSFIQKPFVDYPPSVCDCLKNYAGTFTAAHTDYELTCENSNWAYHCMSTKCGVKVDYPPDKPLGWNCQKCDQWGGAIGPGGCASCLHYIPSPCP